PISACRTELDRQTIEIKLLFSKYLSPNFLYPFSPHLTLFLFSNFAGILTPGRYIYSISVGASWLIAGSRHTSGFLFSLHFFRRHTSRFEGLIQRMQTYEADNTDTATDFIL
ncbi:hypothetical protein LINPERPRIM_LOCUS623, partial [Linum perenne]